MFLKVNLKIEKSMHNLFTLMLSDDKAKTTHHYNPKYKKDFLVLDSGAHGTQQHRPCSRGDVLA